MVKNQMTFVIPASSSNNIGNIFFALGTQYVLKKAFPNARVVLLSDQAAYWNQIPGPMYRKEPRNSLRYLDYVRPNYIVLMGSVLTEQFPKVWGKSLKALYKNGVKIILIGVGHYDYSQREIGLCRELLKKYPPYVFISRDRQTYQNLNDLAKYSYDGLDGAFFIPDLFQPIKADLPPYIISNFDKTPEPNITIRSKDIVRQNDLVKRKTYFKFIDQNWEVRFPRSRFHLSRLLGKSYGYIMGPLGFYGTTQRKAGQFMIIRTDHQINPIMIRRIFRGPNAFAGDIPYTYLNLYAHTELTLSDRIHAVLTSMAYGKPAMLFSRSGRALILERVGAHEVTQKPTCLDMKNLREEKHDEIEFLRSIPL